MTTLTTNELKKLLKTQKVSFEFMKKDGTYRKAMGTLNEELIPEIYKQSNNIKFFDLEKNAWRSISGDTEKIVWYNEVE